MGKFDVEPSNFSKRLPRSPKRSDRSLHLSHLTNGVTENAAEKKPAEKPPRELADVVKVAGWISCGKNSGKNNKNIFLVGFHDSFCLRK